MKHDLKIATLILTLKTLGLRNNHTLNDFLVQHLTALQEAPDFSLDFVKSLNFPALSNLQKVSPAQWRQFYSHADLEMAMVQIEGVDVLMPHMAQYPQRLLKDADHPVLLFSKGNTKLLNSKKIVGVIGTRKPTALGEKLGAHFTENFVKRGYVILGGLAIGSDTVGHKAALAAHGKTIAVIPTAIGAPVYPKSNQFLADDIVKNDGVIVSEYSPLDDKNNKNLVAHLLARDEWQAGLSDGLLAIETSTKGGTNHALKRALKERKPIGLFDYQQTKYQQAYLTDERFSGNRMYIDQKLAYGIYDANSLDQFDQAMKH